jgi:hypothetical protein
MRKPDYPYPLRSPMTPGKEAEELPARVEKLKTYYQTDDWEQIALSLARDNLEGFTTRKPGKPGAPPSRTAEHSRLFWAMYGRVGFFAQGRSQRLASREVALELFGKEDPATVRKVWNAWSRLKRDKNMQRRATQLFDDQLKRIFGE